MSSVIDLSSDDSDDTIINQTPGTSYPHYGEASTSGYQQERKIAPPYSKYSLEDFSDDDYNPPESLSDRIKRLKQDKPESGIANLEELTRKYSTKEPTIGKPPPPQTSQQLAKTQRATEIEDEFKQTRALAYKRIKPTEWKKYVSVYMDKKIVEEQHGKTLLEFLDREEIKHNFRDQIFDRTITFMHVLQEHIPGPGGDMKILEEIREASELLLVFDVVEFVKRLQDNTLESLVQEIRTVLKKKVTLVIYGYKTYMRYLANCRNREFQANISDNSSSPNPVKHHKKFKNLPPIQPKDFMRKLTEIQISSHCSYRHVDTPEQFNTFILQFSKAVSLKPFKREQAKKQEQANFYAQGDKKDSVKINNHGNGLRRLWQQVLANFPLASLETAEAVLAIYPTQKSLIDAYENCSSRSEAEALLKDAPIRRAAGPLVNSRKIGIELSKKIYYYFTSTDSDQLL